MHDRGRIRVMVVDDDPDVRCLLQVGLSIEDELEWVGAANDGREGVALATELQPDAIVLDYAMPDGLDAAPLLREASPKSMVVMFSAQLLPEGAAVARARGVHAVVPKLSGMRLLGATIRQLCLGVDA